MRNYLDSISNFLLERSAEELIVGVFLALLLAVASAGLHALVRGRVKDTVMLLTAVGLVANVVAMILTAGYLRMNSDRNNFDRATVPSGPRPRPAPNQAREVSLDAAIQTIFENSDGDHDGRISADEAAAASSFFVKAAESEAGKPLDKVALGQAIQHRVNVLDGRRQSLWLPSAPGGRSGHPGSAGGRGPATSDAIPLDR